jgi:predicted AlkP superfamily pyrophosphatase or phosphodiesterase
MSDSPRLAVINIVGLTDRVLDRMPGLRTFAAIHGRAVMRPVLPAVTCTAQSTYLTGLLPSGHGIVGNGWYDRELHEHHFWKQSNRLVHGEKLWETARRARPSFTTANLFWWYNMYSTVDWSITPRPMYPADGRKVLDIYTQPMRLRDEITCDLGPFAFLAYWGPMAGIASSKWITEAARWIEEQHRPDLSLIYLPHLDYNLQRLGLGNPEIVSDLRDIDRVASELIAWLEARAVKVIVLSEYGITPVHRSVHPNRILREKGWITVRKELGFELLDCGASRAFALTDHQVAHIYLNDPTIGSAVRDVLVGVDGVAQVLDAEGKHAAGLNHSRAGDLVALSEEDAWFSYYYWKDDAVAPDFARCVDIHRKYGYDPLELFTDPLLRAPKLRVALRLLQKKLGFRTLMDVIPIDPSLVKGSHGCIPADSSDWPLLLGAPCIQNQETSVLNVRSLLLKSALGDEN